MNNKPLRFLVVSMAALSLLMFAGAATRANDDINVTFCHVPQGHPESAQTMSMQADSLAKSGHFKNVEGENPNNGTGHGGDYLGQCITTTPVTSPTMPPPATQPPGVTVTVNPTRVTSPTLIPPATQVPGGTVTAQPTIMVSLTPVS